MTEPRLTEAEREILRSEAAMFVHSRGVYRPSELADHLAEHALPQILRARLGPVEAERDELRQRVTAMEAKLPWPWSTVSLDHERVETLTAAEQNVLSDAVHACEAMSGEAWVHGAFPWQKLREDERDGYRRYARAVLDAVAPAIREAVLLEAAERLLARRDEGDRTGDYNGGLSGAIQIVRDMAAQQREEQD